MHDSADGIDDRGSQTIETRAAERRAARSVRAKRARNWPAKTRSIEELKTRIQKQYEDASVIKWPEQFSAWGGWKSKRLGDGSGFFRTHQDGRRSWLVDPDGYAFWSAGLDCVRVDTNARFDGIEGTLELAARP